MLARKATAAAAGVVQRATAATAAQPQLQPQLQHQPPPQPIVSKTKVEMQMPLLRQLESREVRIPVPWGHIAGKWWGPRDRRPLLALHGFGDNAASFDRLASSLGDVSVLALDLPGHGYSSRLPTGQLPEQLQLLTALRRVQRSLGWTQMSLVGHSTGDALALMYAAMYPSEVDVYVSLDFLAPAPSSGEELLKSGGALLDDAIESHDAESAGKGPESGATREELEERLLTSRSGSLNRHAAAVLLRRGAVESTEGKFHWAGNQHRLPIITAPLAIDAARKVRCAVLAIMPQWRAPKSLRAPETRSEVLDELRLASKALYTREVDGTHHVHLNNPEVIVPAVVDFLETHRSKVEKVQPLS